MRTLKLFESISVDGYFTDATGDMSFAHASPDPEFGAWVEGNAGGGGELLFGRKTYEMMAAFWPTAQAAAQMPAVAQRMNTARKYVASKSLTPTWDNSRLLRGELVSAVRALKAEPGPPIVILGSGSVALQLGDADLIDTYQFVVVPVALGSGRSVFGKRRPLRLIEQRAFRNGNVVLSYAT